MRLFHTLVCKELEEILAGVKLPIECKIAIQNKENKSARQELELHSSVIEILSKVSPSEIKDPHQADPTISQVVQWIRQVTSQKYVKLRRKNHSVRKYLSQFDHLKFRKGVLHQIYEVQGSKYHQLVLPTVYRTQVLQLLHEEQGHQRIEHTLACVRERFLLSTMCQDVTNWVKSCKRCKKAEGLYNDPHLKQMSLIANHPLDLLCLDFTKMDFSKDGKENILL